jgi:UDP-N-acetylmuramate dehydrogenase
MHFSYRSSAVKERGWLVLRAQFKLETMAESRVIKEKMRHYLNERKRKQPLDRPTAGSTFKQPDGGRAAGWYIEQCGLKGMTIGGASISAKHANWIENNGNAKARDIRDLMDLMQQRVEARYGLLLEREVHILE